MAGAVLEDLEITTVLMSSREFGISGAIPAELSDFFPKSLASPITTVEVQPDASVPTTQRCPTASIAHFEQRLPTSALP